MRDKIAEIIVDELKAGGTIETGCAKVIDAMSGMIAPMVWESSAFGHISYSCGLRYHIENSHGKYSCGVSTGQSHPVIYRGINLDEAKAAANAHHVSRIMSSFGVTS